MYIPLNTFMKEAAKDAAIMLGRVLPAIGKDDWWKTCVVAKLSFQQHQRIGRTPVGKLDQLDFATLLRIIDKNWYEIADMESYPPETKTLVHEVIGIRNRIAHENVTTKTIDEDLYRDLDTLKRFLSLLKTDVDTMEKIDDQRQQVLARLANGNSSQELTVSTSSPQTRQLSLTPMPDQTKQTFVANKLPRTVKESSGPEGTPPTEVHLRHKREAEFHKSSIKSAVQVGAELAFVDSSLCCVDRDAATLPEILKDVAAAHIQSGYIVFLDCAPYGRPIENIKAAIDDFLCEAPSLCAGSYLVWFFGQITQCDASSTPIASRTLQTKTSLLPWLDHFIYDEKQAPYSIDPGRVQKNAEAKHADVLWYLGTYFPRSYGETFCIFDNLLGRLKEVGQLANRNALAVLDVGCGSGGALMGLIWAIRKYRADLQSLNITAVDVNRPALDMLSAVIAKTQTRWNTSINLSAHSLLISDAFPTTMIKGKTFDVILTSKMLGELPPAQVNVYQRFLETYAPYLTEQGMLMMLDVPTKTSGEALHNPIRMANAANHFVRSSKKEFRTLLPLPCAYNGHDCKNGCFLNKRFTIRTSRESQIESDVCYHLIARSELANKMLTPHTRPQIAFQCPPARDAALPINSGQVNDPFCL